MTKKHDIIWLDSTDSTNDELRRHICDIDNLSVTAALEQTAGKGQRGNKWHSARGKNLLFSIALKFDDLTGPHFQAYDQFSINEMAALSVVDFLAAHSIKAKIKWPNDIYVNDRKICGMLIENSIQAGRIAWSIVGIGINVNQTEFSRDTGNPTSMAIETARDSATAPEELDIREALQEFMDIFKGYMNRYLHISGGLGKLHLLYLAQLWRINENHRFRDYRATPTGHHEGPMGILTETGDSARIFRGKITGVSDVGQLVVEEEDGTISEFGFKEIGYIL